MTPNPLSTRYLLRQILRYSKPYYGVFLLGLALLLFNAFSRLAGPVLLQRAVDHYIVPGNFEGLLGILGLYAGLLVLGAVTQYTQIMQLETAGQHIIAGIKRQAFHHVLHLDMAYFDQMSTGKLVSHIENDANAMKVLFTSVITHVLGNLLLFLGMFAVMAIGYDSWLALAVLWLCPFMLVGAVLFNKWMAPRLVKVRQYVAEVSGYITEMLQGLAVIQMFGQEQRVMDELERRSLKKYHLERTTSITFNAFFNLLFFMESIGTVLVLWLGGNMVMRGEMTIGGLLLFLSFIHQFFVPIMFLSAQFNEFQKGLAGATRLFQLLTEKPNLTDPPHPQPLPNHSMASIEFRQVWFRYQDDADWVLKDISFHCPAGQQWAIVGPTGSGKTSLIHLILKFYVPQQGQILIDGIDIAQLTQHDLRQRIGLVLQDTLLFPGTIYDNLVLHTEHPDKERTLQYLRHMGLDSLLERLPQGYETPVREDTLSSGEKQLINFSRALLKEPAILILDEATSHIDPETERNIQRAMETLLAGRTAFIIAHRLSTIQRADRILVLKKGALIESGSHHELMQQQGFYAELIRLQRVVAI